MDERGEIYWRFGVAALSGDMTPARKKKLYDEAKRELALRPLFIQLRLLVGTKGYIRKEQRDRIRVVLDEIDKVEEVK